jgi:hypothetical protein
MTKPVLVATICLAVAMYAGSSGIVQTTWAAQKVKPGAGTHRVIKHFPTAMTVGECKNLGCKTSEAANCPAITHDYSIRHWSCVCSGGSSCINESSAQ